jgi:hypothetical protein
MKIVPSIGGPSGLRHTDYAFAMSRKKAANGRPRDRNMRVDLFSEFRLTSPSYCGVEQSGSSSGS